MDQELKAKWVAALRSGEWKKTKGELKNPNGFCCLGVLRALDNPTNEADDHNEFLLHEADALRFGLTREKQKFLADMNDGSVRKGIPEHSFAQIADYIEANL